MPQPTGYHHFIVTFKFRKCKCYRFDLLFLFKLFRLLCIVCKFEHFSNKKKSPRVSIGITSNQYTDQLVKINILKIILNLPIHKFGMSS